MVAQKSLGLFTKSMSGNLVIKKGDPKTILKQLIDSYDITDVCWNARYSKQELSQDNEIEEYIIKQGLTLNIYHSTLLRDPSKTLKKMALLSKYIHLSTSRNIANLNMNLTITISANCIICQQEKAKIANRSSRLPCQRKIGIKSWIVWNRAKKVLIQGWTPFYPQDYKVMQKIEIDLICQKHPCYHLI